MRKKIIVVFALVCFFILATSFIGCTNKFDDENQIIAPINIEYPIVGIYETKPFEDIKIVKRVEGNGINEINFDKENVYLDGQVYSGVKYKTRTVDTNQYTVYYLKCRKDEVGLKEDKVQVISIYEKSNLVADILDIGKERILVNVDGKLISMQKSQKEVSANEIKINNELKNKQLEGTKKELQSYATLFLGIRSREYEKNTGGEINDKYTYNTVGINIVNKKVNKVHKAPLLIIPRKTGFWTIDNYQLEFYGCIENAFESKLLTSAEEDKTYLDKTVENKVIDNKKIPHYEVNDLKEKNIKMYQKGLNNSSIRINFVCDNYVGFEILYIVNDNNSFINKDRVEYYYMHTLDGIGNGSVELKDMLSINNYENVVNIENSLNNKSQVLSDKDFKLKRENGYWCVIGKVMSSNQYKVVNEIVLNVNPVKDIVKYDELSVSWRAIKEKIPFAIDAYCSPNKDAIVILTEKKIYVFSIVNKAIDENLYEMDLKEGDTAIMAEWAVGGYAEKWINVCSKY